MVGGGKDAFIGSVHRIASRIDDKFEFVAGCLSSTPEKSQASGKELGLDSSRIYSSFKEMAEKISKGKISKFINDNTLLNQIWIMDPKKKVSDILKENKIDKEVKVLDFIRYKVGEGV